MTISAEQRKANRRLALGLVAVALLFGLSFVLKRIWFGA
jgi:hypothetical protein